MELSRDSSARTFALIVVLAALASGVALLVRETSPPPHPALPAQHQEGGYKGSGSCRSCHPVEHASWNASYHSTMTRRSQTLSWDGESSPKLPKDLELYSRRFRFFQEGTRVFVEGPDLHAIGRKLATLSQQSGLSAALRTKRAEELFSTEAEVKRELLLVTGSHHYLAFWLEGGDTRELRQLPFVYLLSEERFLPRKDAFLQPPDAFPRVARWNANCVQCHSVAAKPQQEEGREAQSGLFWERYDTETAELGIACEACHGPGAKHVEVFQNPLARSLLREEDGEKHIYLPGEDAGMRGSETCGQCHSYFVPKYANEWWNSGFSENYSAGDKLDDSRLLLTPKVEAPPAQTEALSHEHLQASALIDAHEESIFWSDGSMIVGGREFNGLRASPCFIRGQGERKLGCTSCHSLHNGDRDGQLDSNKKGNKLCTQCHNNLAPQHSRHSPDSSASQCVSCHMPKTSYALLQGLASHRITSPQAKFKSPPNACVLCHVDRPEAWFHEALAEFGVQGAKPTPSNFSEGVPLAAKRALSGNAAERAIYAFALGSPEALECAGPEIPTQILSLLKTDSYAAVRLIAERSEKRLKEVAPPSSSSSSLPIDDSTIKALLKERDETPIVISE